MKTVAIIPARYNSSRFKGKPLEDICGKPMVWWVYRQVKRCKNIEEVYVATDDYRIEKTCKENRIDCIMTSKDHKTSTERIYEVAKSISSDVYVCINGDEPLINPFIVEKVIPNKLDNFFASNLITRITNPVEVVDETNIKVVFDKNDDAILMSRSPIPHPKSSINFDYYKHLGVLAYSLEALNFFSSTERGFLEKIEDINELRFIENKKPLKMIKVDANTLSVDTPKDLMYVKKVISRKIERGEINL